MTFLKAFETGAPVPPGIDHAIACGFKTWADVVRYEAGDSTVTDLIQMAYPRFFYHKFYRQLCERYAAIHAKRGEAVMALPSEKVARECKEFVGVGRIVRTNDGVTLIIVPDALVPKAKSFWQHTGQIVSSRQAAAILEGKPVIQDATHVANTGTIKSIIAHDFSTNSNTPTEAGDVYLYPTGMSAIYEAYQAVTSEVFGCRRTRTIQLGFPYVDSWKIQQKFGDGAVYLPYDSIRDLHAVREIVLQGGISAVFCEIPGNPLLRTVSLPDLTSILEPAGIPLIIDNTLGPPINVNVLDHEGLQLADVVVTSLTKFYSGGGDVMGGSLVLNNRSKHYRDLKRYLHNEHEDLMYSADADVLLSNMQDFPERMSRINKNTEILVRALKAHPKVKTVYSPLDDPAYRMLQVSGGIGGLFSFELHVPEAAPDVYDQLELPKCPGIGYSFTAVCPITMLAHFNELDWAKEQGVSSFLLRVSVGTEEPSKILAPLNHALSFAPAPGA